MRRGQRRGRAPGDREGLEEPWESEMRNEEGMEFNDRLGFSFAFHLCTKLSCLGTKKESLLINTFLLWSTFIYDISKFRIN